MPVKVSAIVRLTMLAMLVAATLRLPAPPAAAAAPAAGNGAVVIMYHRFGENDYPSTSIRLEQFEAHLAELKKPKYTVMPLSAIVAALREDRPLPDHAVAITVDDAYASFWREAVPRLREAGFPFTLFVATRPVDRELGGYMTWDQLRELDDMKLAAIGSQSHSHPHMPDLSLQGDLEELRTGQDRFRAELGHATELIAYPYGEYSLAVQTAARQAGFVAGFGQHSGAIGRANDLYGLPRFAFNEGFGEMDRFRLAVNTLPLPVRDVAPEEKTLAPQTNPPMYGFTVDESAGPLDSLSCFASGRGRLETEIIASQRVEVRLDKPFPPGRARINCTMPGPDGRWRWFGNQFYIAGE